MPKNNQEFLCKLLTQVRVLLSRVHTGESRLQPSDKINDSSSDRELSGKFGYLSIVSLDQDMLSGGYLLVDHFGRPEEFHFSIPFAADPAQKILFGRTFRSFVFCEQIGKPLLQKSTQKPDLILVRQSELLDLGNAGFPVVYPVSEDALDQEKLETDANPQLEVAGVKLIEKYFYSFQGYHQVSINHGFLDFHRVVICIVVNFIIICHCIGR